MDFNEATLEFELNFRQAALKLQLHQHARGINVALALTQHSLYYKVASCSSLVAKSKDAA